jgi:hypothetical protein
MKGPATAMTIRVRWLAIGAAAMLASVALGGCSGDRILGSSPSEQPPPPPNARPAARAGPQTPPPVDMAGRWQLASTAGGACAMTFAASPGSPEGTIAPEGGCPGNFFTSRRWVFDQNALVIRNHTGATLASLAFSPPARFDGQGANGETISLTR